MPAPYCFRREMAELLQAGRPWAGIEWPVWEAMPRGGDGGRGQDSGQKKMHKCPGDCALRPPSGDSGYEFGGRKCLQRRNCLGPRGLSVGAAWQPPLIAANYDYWARGAVVPGGCKTPSKLMVTPIASPTSFVSSRPGMLNSLRFSSTWHRKPERVSP